MTGAATMTWLRAAAIPDHDSSPSAHTATAAGGAAAAGARRAALDVAMASVGVNPIACTGHGLCAELLPAARQPGRVRLPVVSPQPITPEQAR